MQILCLICVILICMTFSAT